MPKGLLGLLEVAFAELQRAEETHWSPLHLLGSLGPVEPVEPVEIPVETPVETPQNGDMDSRSHPPGNLGNLACHDKWPIHIYKMETIAWPKKAVQSTIQCWHEDAHEDVCQIARKRFNVIQGIEVIILSVLSVLCHGLYKCANVLYQSLGQHGFEAFPNVQVSHVAMLGMGKELEFRKEQTGDK